MEISKNSKIYWNISCFLFVHHVFFCRGDRTQFSQSTSCKSDRIFKMFWLLMVNIALYCYLYIYIYVIYYICIYCVYIYIHYYFIIMVNYIYVIVFIATSS